MNQSHEKLRHFVTGKQWEEKIPCRLRVDLYPSIVVRSYWQFVQYKSPKTIQSISKVTKKRSWSKCFRMIKWSIRQLVSCMQNALPSMSKYDERSNCWNEISMATYSSFRRIFIYSTSRTVLNAHPLVRTFDICTAFSLLSTWRIYLLIHIYEQCIYIVFSFSHSFYIKRNTFTRKKRAANPFFLSWLLSFLCNFRYALNITFTYYYLSAWDLSIFLYRKLSILQQS